MRKKTFLYDLSGKPDQGRGGNEFDVICGDKVIYRGTASWFPVGLDRTNKVTLTDPAGNLLFETRFNPIEHFVQSAKKKTSG